MRLEIHKKAQARTPAGLALKPDKAVNFCGKPDLKILGKPDKPEKSRSFSTPKPGLGLFLLTENGLGRPEPRLERLKESVGQKK